MPTAYFQHDPSKRAYCAPLEPLQQEVIKAYFATKKSKTKYKNKTKVHTTAEGETLSKIAKKYGVKTKNVERTKTTKYLQIGEKVKVTIPERIGEKVTFKKIDNAIIGEEVYIVVETLHLEDEIVLINILQGEEEVLAKLNEKVKVQQDGKDVGGQIRTQVSNYTKESDITNKDDFINLAIAKVILEPASKEKQKQWKDNLECNSQNKAKLYLLIDVHSENSIPNFKSHYIQYDGYKGKGDDSNVSNHFLNEDDTWFEVSYKSVLDEMKEIVDKHIPYSQDGEREEDTLIGWKALDCSELVMRYLYKLGAMSDLKNIYTGLMTTESDFRKAIGSQNIKFVSNSKNDDFKPEKGDIFVWRTSSGGHTGIVYDYDDTKDLVTILEAIGSGGSKDSSTNKNNGGYTKNNCTRTAVYKRKGSALNQHSGWKGYFRPINYTKSL